MKSRFKPYPEYKDSGVEWLGEIPEGWDVAKHARRFRSAMGQTILREDLVDGGAVPVYSATESGGIFGQIDNPVVSLDSGDLVIPARGSIGYVILITERSTCTQTTIYSKVIGNHGISPNYVRYFMLGHRNVLFYYDQTAIPQITVDQVNSNPLLVPPLPEQRAIADFLDLETGKVDALVAEKECLIKLLQEKLTALITQTVTKGLDPNVPMKDSGIKWLGKIPAHWEIKRLKYAARLESGHTPKRSVPEYWTDKNDIPWVSLNDTKQLALNDYITDTTLCVNALGLTNSSAHLLPERVVVFTRDATIGKAAITTRPMAVSQHIIAWVCRPELIPEYLLRVFDVMGQELEGLTEGATLRTIGMPEVRSLVTPIPPVHEQQNIIETLFPKLAKFVKAVATVKSQIDRLREYRSALISAAVTGKIDVRGLA